MTDRHTADTITDDDLDQLYGDRDRLAATLREVLDAFEAYWARASYCGPGGSTVQPEHLQAWRATLTQPAAATEATEPASWLLAGTRDLNIPATPVPCPACARAGQAGLAPTEQHPTCRTQEQH
jgi:hypothetical protein